MIKKKYIYQAHILQYLEHYCEEGGKVAQLKKTAPLLLLVEGSYGGKILSQQARASAPPGIKTIPKNTFNAVFETPTSGNIDYASQSR